MKTSSQVPVGIGTVLGLVATVASAALAVVQSIEQGAPLLSGANKPAAIIAFAAPLVTALGRMYQGAHLSGGAAVAATLQDLPTLEQELASPPVAAPESAALPDGAVAAVPAAAV